MQYTCSTTCATPTKDALPSQQYDHHSCPANGLTGADCDDRCSPPSSPLFSFPSCVLLLRPLEVDERESFRASFNQSGSCMGGGTPPPVSTAVLIRRKDVTLLDCDRGGLDPPCSSSSSPPLGDDDDGALAFAGGGALGVNGLSRVDARGSMLPPVLLPPRGTGVDSVRLMATCATNRDGTTKSHGRPSCVSVRPPCCTSSSSSKGSLLGS